MGVGHGYDDNNGIGDDDDGDSIENRGYSENITIEPWPTLLLTVEIRRHFVRREDLWRIASPPPPTNFKVVVRILRIPQARTRLLRGNIEIWGARVIIRLYLDFWI